MQDATPERWLPIPGWQGFYEASDLGRIRSVPRKWCKGQIRKAALMPRGYLVVALCRPGYQKQCYVHQLILLTFLHACPEGMEVRHWDGNPANNRLCNLVYGTHADNMEDKIRHGTVPAGAAHSCAVLTDAEVAAMRAAWSTGERVADLAERFQVSHATACRIVKGNAYRDSERPERPRETCHYPGCEALAEEGTNSKGLPLVYCPEPGHSNPAAKSERRRRARAARRRNCLRCGSEFHVTRSDKVYCTRQCKTRAYFERLAA